MTRQLTREDVIAAARSLLEQEGVQGLSMRRLATALGTSYQVVYSRVGGKGEVARAVHEAGFAELRATATLPQPEEAEAHLVGIAHRYLAFAAGQPRLFELMFGAPLVEFTRDAQARAVEWEAFRACWVAASRAWLDEHVPSRPTGSARQLAWRIWTVVHGITVLHLAGHATPSGDVERELADAVRRVLDSHVRAMDEGSRTR